MIQIQRSYKGGAQSRKMFWGDLAQIIGDLYIEMGGKEDKGEFDLGQDGVCGVLYQPLS